MPMGNRINHKVRPLTERYWEKVDKDGPIPEHMSHLGKCWLWTGAKVPWGHGRIGSGGGCGRTLPAHRVSWVLNVGPIPPDIQVLHKCDNPSCQNPTHLFLGTNIDNREDSRKKGRPRKGEQHHAAKLTDIQIKEAVELYRTGMSQRLVAQKFNVSQSSISTFVRGLRRNK